MTIAPSRPGRFSQKSTRWNTRLRFTAPRQCSRSRGPRKPARARPSAQAQARDHTGPGTGRPGAGAGHACPGANRTWPTPISRVTAACITTTSTPSPSSEVDTTKGSFDAAQAALEAAKANVTGAQSNVDAAKAQAESAQARCSKPRRPPSAPTRPPSTTPSASLSYCTITSPTDGRVGNKNVEVGNRLPVGQAIYAVVRAGPLGGCQLQGNATHPDASQASPSS